MKAVAYFECLVSLFPWLDCQLTLTVGFSFWGMPILGRPRETTRQPNQSATETEYGVY